MRYQYLGPVASDIFKSGSDDRIETFPFLVVILFVVVLFTYCLCIFTVYFLCVFMCNTGEINVILFFLYLSYEQFGKEVSCKIAQQNIDLSAHNILRTRSVPISFIHLLIQVLVVFLT